MPPLTRFSALALTLLTLTGCAGGPTGGPPAFPPMPVTQEVLAPRAVANRTDYLGTMVSRQSVTLESKIIGVVEQVHVTAGDFVQAGQLLVSLRAVEEAARVNSRQAEVTSAQSQVRQAQDALKALEAQRDALQATLSLNETQEARYRRLLAQQAASQEEVDRYAEAVRRNRADLAANEAQRRAQQAAVAAARGEVSRARADVGEEAAKVGDRRIRAPFSGIVGDIPAKVGSTVQPLTPVLSLTRNQPLELNIQLPADAIGRVKPGTVVEIDDDSDGPLVKTTIQFIAPRLTPETQTLLVKAPVANPENRFRAEQTVRVQVVWSRQEQLTVPATAVLHLGGRDFVYVAQPMPGGKGFQAKQRPVVLGDLVDGRYVVQSGLERGLRLITGGIQKIGDGAPVQLPAG